MLWRNYRHSSYISYVEGWYIHKQSISTISHKSFATDELARDFIVAQAEAGDPLAIKALSTLTKRRLTEG